MKKLFVPLLAVLLPFAVFSQVVVTLQLPAVGLSVKSQLWNMAISNTSTNEVSIKIKMIMTDISNGQQVLSGTTGSIAIPQGNKMLQYADVLPVSYTVLNSNYAVDATPDGFLPLGNFNICFEIVKQEYEVVESLAEECITAEVEPVSPPYLNSPADMSEAEEARPLFTWVPPAPANLFTNLSYTLKLVELLPGQNSADAVQQNFPIISEQNIQSPNLAYPPSLLALDTGKTYAWQIAANSNGIPVSSSEIWTFRVKVFDTDNTPPALRSPFIRLSMDAGSGYFTCDGVLKFEYINEINDSLVSVNVYDISGEERKEVSLDSNHVVLQFGQNLISMDLRDNNGFVPGQMYSLEIINSKQEIWRGRFEYKPTVNQ